MLSAEDFWTFSITLYSREYVATHCLQLQDKHTCNVNLLLFCCWLQHNEQQLSMRSIKALSSAISDSDDALKVHRAKRRAAKGNLAVYEKLKTTELDLEKQQQTILINAFHPTGQLADNKIDPITAFCSFYSLSTEIVNRHIFPVLEMCR